MNKARRGSETRLQTPSTATADCSVFYPRYLQQNYSVATLPCNTSACKYRLDTPARSVYWQTQPRVKHHFSCGMSSVLGYIYFFLGHLLSSVLRVSMMMKKQELDFPNAFEMSSTNEFELSNTKSARLPGKKQRKDQRRMPLTCVWLHEDKCLRRNGPQKKKSMWSLQVSTDFVLGRRGGGEEAL